MSARLVAWRVNVHVSHVNVEGKYYNIEEEMNRREGKKT